MNGHMLRALFFFVLVNLLTIFCTYVIDNGLDFDLVLAGNLDSLDTAAIQLVLALLFSVVAATMSRLHQNFAEVVVNTATIVVSLLLTYKLFLLSQKLDFVQEFLNA